MNQFEITRLCYKPDRINYLLVAEAPPKVDSNRFFYFEDVMEQDSLYIETMKVLYPTDALTVPTIDVRLKKKNFLERFKKDGFYLIDSLIEPLEEALSPTKKIQRIRQGQQELLKTINSMVSKKTKVILVSATVYKANYEFLRKSCVDVINKELIDFPGSGRQKKYREKMTTLLFGEKAKGL
jgi:hypothetical protein